MSITLKDFGQFILDFVNDQFLPLLQIGQAEHDRCLEQWKEVSELIQEI